MHYLKFIVPIALILLVGGVVLANPSFQKFSLTGGDAGTTPPNSIVCPTGQHSNGTECVADSDTNATFSATPTSGAAPLTVTFFNMATAGPMTADMYPKINYGDGTTENAARCVEGGQETADTCTAPGKNIHTYASPGTYTATLSKHIGGPSGPEQLIATVTITVR